MEKALKKGIIFLLVFFVLVSGGCLQIKSNQEKTQSLVKYEITQVDVFSKKDWTSQDISIMGVQLGDSKDDVIAKIGQPDLATEYPNSTNFEYRERLTLDSIGLLVHFEGDSVTLMTLRPSFNRFLIGNTQIKHSKDTMFRRFGNPDKTTLLSHFTVYSYNDIGLDVHINANKEIGFSLKKVESP